MAIVIGVQVKLFNVLESRPVLKREFLTDHYSLVSHCLGDLLFDLFQSLTAVSFFLIVLFWAVGFQGSFMYTLAILVLFALILQSLAILLTVLTNNPKHSIQLITLVICKWRVR